jgi:hypothetical protein
MEPSVSRLRQEPGTSQPAGYPNDLLNRTSTGHPGKNRPLLIGLGNWSLRDLQDQRKTRRLPMAQEDNRRPRERLQFETPTCDDASLSELEETVAEYIREAKRRDPLLPDELISTVVDAVARNYFRHELRKQAHMAPLRRRTRA